jgi:hypothetical protein
MTHSLENLRSRMEEAMAKILWESFGVAGKMSMEDGGGVQHYAIGLTIRVNMKPRLEANVSKMARPEKMDVKNAGMASPIKKK